MKTYRHRPPALEQGAAHHSPQSRQPVHLRLLYLRKQRFELPTVKALLLLLPSLLLLLLSLLLLLLSVLRL